MAISYAQWCSQNDNAVPLVKALRSSMPEQYIGFYLEKVFGAEVEYQKQFTWLGNRSIDIYIPSLQIAIEYNGVYYHSTKKVDDNEKERLCRGNGIYLIKVIEQTANQPPSRRHNEISYYYGKNYKNIGEVVNALIKKINKKYGTSLSVDVDLKRDAKTILAYIQNKYYKRSIAYIWPEITDYWIDEENDITMFDVSSRDYGKYWLKCPHCGSRFALYMRYCQERTSLIPCDCERQAVENNFAEALRHYKETGDVAPFDGSLRSRRLYDRMAVIATRIWNCESREEAEMYKKAGFDPKYIDVYISLCEKRDSQALCSISGDCN